MFTVYFNHLYREKRSCSITSFFVLRLYWLPCVVGVGINIDNSMELVYALPKKITVSTCTNFTNLEVKLVHVDYTSKGINIQKNELTIDILKP